MKVKVKQEQNERKSDKIKKSNQVNVLAGRTESEIRKHAAQWSNVRENEAAEEEIF